MRRHVRYLFLFVSLVLGYTNHRIFAQSDRFTVRKKAVFSGHTRDVNALAFTTDGQILATSASRDKIIRLWSATTGKAMGQFPGDSSVSSLSFASSGRTFASWSFERTISLWDVEAGSLKARLEHEKFVSAVAFSPDSRTVATASFNDLSVMLWDTQTGRLKTMLSHPKLNKYTNGVGNVIFTPDGKTLATSSERTVYLWDVATEKLRMKLVDPDVRVYTATWRRLEGFSHADTIYDLAIDSNDRTLATGSRDGTAKLWDVASGELRAILKGHKGRVHRLAFSPDGRILATGSDDKTARLWDVVTGQLKATLKHRGTVWSLSFSSDSRIIATGGDNEHAINLWDSATGELITILTEARLPVVFSPVGQTLATADEKNNVLLWDVLMK